MEKDAFRCFSTLFLIYKDEKAQREWAFDVHGCFDAYLGPVTKTIDQHYFYRFETKRICIIDSYHILEHRPSEWDSYIASVDKIFKIQYEDEDLLKDLYSPYNGSIITIQNDTTEPKEPSESESEEVHDTNQHSMTLTSRIRIINSSSMSDNDSNDSDDSEKVHVIQQASNPNNVSINASAIPGHQEMEVDRWGPTQLSNLDYKLDTTAPTSQDDNKINRVWQRPKVVHPTNLTEQSSTVLSVSKP